MKERHVMVVLPHPDDESAGCAGTLALFARAGTPITYLCGTLGEMGRNLGRGAAVNRETLPAVRHRELLRACEIIGITDLRLMGLHDKTIEFEDRQELAGRIAAVITEVKPSLLITHYPGFSVHPDHDAMGAAAVEAVASLPPAERPRIWCQGFARGMVEAVGEPDVLIDIRATLPVKIQAMMAHESQFGAMVRRIQANPALRLYEYFRRRRERFWTYALPE